jgi:predicted protein tyrosine phosphatase
MNFLYVCSSNKDRSPALSAYIAATNKQHNHKSAGINKYFCEKNKTTLITKADVEWADVIVCMEHVHYKRMKELFKLDEETPDWLKRKAAIVLNNGEFTPNSSSAEDWLMRAEDKISYYLKISSTNEFPHKILQNPHIY